MVVDGELVAEPLYGWLSSNYKACDLTYLTGASLLLYEGYATGPWNLEIFLDDS